MVLLAFNDTDCISIEALMSELGVDKLLLDKALASILNKGILTIQDNVISLNVTSFKANYQSPIRLNDYLMDPDTCVDPERVKLTEATVYEDRQHQLDATIIRIMKKVKRCSVAYLVDEITRSSKTEIAKRIESLIDREFLERTNDDEISYLA